MTHACLTAPDLRQTTDPSALPCSTDLAPAFDPSVLQPHAVKALNTAFDIPQKGYHAFCLGEAGLGKHTLVSHLLKQRTPSENTPNDWVYLHNFDDERRPQALALPSGFGQPLKDDFCLLWSDIVKTSKNMPTPQNLEKSIKPLFDKLCKHYQSKLPTQTAHTLCVYLNRCLQQTLTISLDDKGMPACYAIAVISTQTVVPVVFESLATPTRLVGNIEYKNELGYNVSDVSMIRSGALHRANGGYLILEAQNLLEKQGWHTLKHALKTTQVTPIFDHQGVLSLEPQAIPLTLKVILIGSMDTYELLLEDPEFLSLFKVCADFKDSIERSDHEIHMVAKIADMAHTHALLPFDNQACARLIDELCRLSGHQQKIALHSDTLLGLVFEANRHAKLVGADIVGASHVQQALDDIEERQSQPKQLYWQEFKSGQQLVSTHGYALGQINALTIIEYGETSFGMPARLTAAVAPKTGTGEVLDIERDVELGGSLHAKAMLIVSSFLKASFGHIAAPNFSAAIAFEQNYGEIDGDSASLAACCALLSALSKVALAQNLAITGSMNQLGQAQAVGGVNAKIEGFFDLCAEQGLDGSQGVIIPRTNAINLMLAQRVLDAVREGRFCVYVIDDIYDALFILTQIPINDTTKKGSFKKGTLFYRIAQCLLDWQKECSD